MENGNFALFIYMLEAISLAHWWIFFIILPGIIWS